MLSRVDRAEGRRRDADARVYPKANPESGNAPVRGFSGNPFPRMKTPIRKLT